VGKAVAAMCVDIHMSVSDASDKFFQAKAASRYIYFFSLTSA